ncbi:MAG: trehalose-phosphatase [Beutenbergiaceae bacterium]
MSTLDGALARFAARDRGLVALDFDGCLAPIVPHPDDARPLPQAAGALTRLATAANLRLALISGRSLHSLATVATPPAGTMLVGSHGAERGVITADGTAEVMPLELTGQQRAELAQLVRIATEVIAPEADAGAWLEHKPTAVVVHTRALPPERAEAVETATLAATADRPARALRGKRVVELCAVPSSKGIAVDELRASTGADAVLYAGDDVTDEDALARLGAEDVGVKVGPGDTVARYRVADPQAVATMLTDLADLTVG